MEQDPGREVLKQCETQYKASMLEGVQSIPCIKRELVEPAKATDPIKRLYDSYISTTAMHTGIGGLLSFLLARTLTSRMAFAPRMGATVLFTALGGAMGAARASSLAYRDFVKESMAYVETAEWARVVVCPHVKHLEPCVAMSDCQELLRSKVDGGKDLLRCYRACTGRTAPAEDVDWGH